MIIDSETQEYYFYNSDSEELTSDDMLFNAFSKRQQVKCVEKERVATVKNFGQGHISDGCSDGKDLYIAMHRLQRGGATVLDVVASHGSVDIFLRIFEFLFQTHRVETFTLDLLLDLWSFFPETAQHVLRFFSKYQCWQQLLLLVERSRHHKYTKRIVKSALSILKQQWRTDVKALTSSKYDELSDLALWLRKQGRDLEKSEYLYRLFLTSLYPREKSASARAMYNATLLGLRDAVNRQRTNVAAAERRNQDNITAIGQTSQMELGMDQRIVPVCLTGTIYTNQPYFEHNAKVDKDSDVTMVKNSRATFFQSQSIIWKETKAFFEKGMRIFDQSSQERILYIHQRELGHATAAQCDVIVSDRATTCHILTVRSVSQQAPALTSLAHIDSTCYDDCLTGMIQTHIRHHYNCYGYQNNNAFTSGDKLQMTIDIAGGYEDARGSSRKISAWLFQTLESLARDHQDVATMTIRTCAASAYNDNGGHGPIGRGMGIDLKTGEAFLAKVDSSVVGPALHLRSARLWADGTGGVLSVVHTANSHNNTTQEFVIQPFEFEPFKKLPLYLQLPDSDLLQITSTSPDMEESDFCYTVKNTLRFIQEIQCTHVFGPDLDRPLVFQRINSTNTWRRRSS